MTIPRARLAELGKHLSSRDRARQLREQLLAELRDTATQITVELDGVLSISDSFADEFFAVLAAQRGERWFKDHVRVLGGSDVVRAAIVRMLALDLKIARFDASNSDVLEDLRARHGGNHDDIILHADFDGQVIVARCAVQAGDGFSSAAVSDAITRLAALCETLVSSYRLSGLSPPRAVEVIEPAPADASEKDDPALEKTIHQISTQLACWDSVHVDKVGQADCVTTKNWHFHRADEVDKKRS